MAGLMGAGLLARGQGLGMAAFDGSPQEVRRSFWAAALSFPLFFALARIAGVDEPVSFPWLREALSFTITWVVFALMSERMATVSGYGRNWPRFMSAWNWSNLIQYAVLLAATIPGRFVPDVAEQIVSLVAVGYALWLEWFVTRQALGVPGPMAVLFVVLDVALGLFIHGLIGG
ncbi:hypothetical protein EOD42_06300 [Rhodovarius crocodyli]|uniref:Uncharacterized protein n=1 Tax=Rhodovarius crocodyli TaxID=1979269 RepID=A0A437MIF6_9PROT|nr:hypothetical protein [Rhodovarius crocodyli]RVT97438.1 hypothetical protein EOD42_06300 [Rhodovarius crocodyli]